LFLVEEERSSVREEKLTFVPPIDVDNFSRLDLFAEDISLLGRSDKRERCSARRKVASTFASERKNDGR